MKKKIEFRNILNKFLWNLSSVSSSSFLSAQFLAWSKISKEQVNSFEKIGIIYSETVENESDNSNLNYWDEDSQIDFEMYPYNGCGLYKLKNTPYFYLIYTEFGGHYPEIRCRLIRRELIDLSKIEDIYVIVENGFVSNF